MSKRDYYEVLGIPKNADDATIKSAYRKLAKKYHPDVSQEDNAEAKFKEVQEAYEVLSDGSKRQQYDTFGHQANDGQGFTSSGFDFDINDIFSSFFGGGASRTSQSRARKGQDLQRRMNVSFEEAIFGAKKKIKVTAHDECTSCHGTGAYSKGDIKTCSKCHGSGSVTVEQQSIFGRTRTQQSCPNCNGTGKEITRKCGVCHGEGTISREKEIEVTVPKGIDSGQQIRLEGYGRKGVNGGPAGDLYILFEVKANPLYDRHGDDLVLELPITFVQAALGDSVKVPTPHGDVKLKVPPGTQSTTTFRLRGKGAPNVRSKRLGDLHVVITVVTPESLSRQQMKLFEQLGKTDLTKQSNIWTKYKKAVKKG